MELIWHVRSFAELTNEELYTILQLRQRVFVVEQSCAYLDADGFDQAAVHVWAARDRAIVAYARILPAGAKYPEPSIGRVITAPEVRGTGVGRELMKRSIAAVGNGAIRINAQMYLERFYSELGFARVSEPYDDDGIQHIEMLKPAAL